MRFDFDRCLFIGPVEGSGGRKLEINGYEVSGLPRSKALKGMTAYLCGGITIPQIRRFLRAGDTVSGPGISALSSATVALDKGYLTIRSCEAWGGRGASAEDFSAELKVLSDQLSERMTYTAGAFAKNTFWRHAPKCEAIELPPVFRGISIDCTHVGPMLVYSVGSHANHVQMDRKAAYLQALKAGLPVGESWRIDAHPNVEGEGFARIVGSWNGHKMAEMEEPHLTGPRAVLESWSKEVRAQGYRLNKTSAAAGYLAPIPVSTMSGEKSWQRFHRCYVSAPKAWIREAMDTGLRVYRVVDSASCSVEPWAEGFIAEIDGGGLPKKAAKAAYQRVATAIGGFGWYSMDALSGEVSGEPEPWYKWIGRKIRPDISAYVLSHNAQAMGRAVCRESVAGRLIAAHLDAVWIAVNDGGVGAGYEEGWAVKSEGRIEFTNTGTYQTDGAVKIKRGVRESLSHTASAAYEGPVYLDGALRGPELKEHKGCQFEEERVMLRREFARE